MMMDPPLQPMTSSRYQIQNPSFDICKGFDEQEPETLDLNSRSESVKLKKYAETVELEESPKSGSFQWRTHENQTRKTEYEVESGLSEVKRTCVDCQTTKTPLWRGGPAGPKSLCNACGIRYRKRRRAALGLNTDEKEKRVRNKQVGVSLKVQLLALGGDVYVQRSSSTVSILQKKRKLAKEEEAAVLLMALSCGLLHA